MTGAEMEKIHVTLIPFASEPSSTAVQQAMLDIGYRVDLLRSDDWLDRRPNATSDFDVLLLGNKDLPCERMHSVLLRQNGLPTFAILSNGQLNGSTRILELCEDFLTWPCPEQELAWRLDRLTNKGDWHSTDITDQDAMLEEFVGLNLVGKSEIFLETLSLIKKIAKCEAPVLIHGETGTGKEVAARAIHYLGPRRDHPFVPVNCGALPDNLIENELFGHERGAYTDAKQGQAGVIEQANGGTLFLDEVETLTYKGQVTLLRFLQDQQYRPLGGKSTRQANVRIIAASNTSLQEMAERGEYRQDLLFRLNIMSVNVPPLRERTGDIELLAEYFIWQYGDRYQQANKYLHPETLAWMTSHPWPGNVRELENFIHREFLLADKSIISIDSGVCAERDDRRALLDRRQSINFDGAFSEAKSHVINEFEKRYLYSLMERAHWNVTYAATLACKERRALGKLLKKHDIKKNK